MGAHADTRCHNFAPASAPLKNSAAQHGRPLHAVRLLSAVPPPYGGVSVWTERFLAAAAAAQLRVTLQPIGPRRSDHTRGLMGRLWRLWRGLIVPLWQAIAHVRATTVLHVCVSGGISFWRGLLLAAIASRRGRPCVVHLHSQARTCATWALQWARHLTRHRPVALVTPSAADVRALGFGHAIANFVPANFGDGVRWQGLHSHGLRLVYMGWMTADKGIMTLLTALHAVPGVHLDAFGPDVAPAELRLWRQQITDLGLSARVRYGGSLPPNVVAERLCQYDALVLPSAVESFSLIAAEAMALGVPVVAAQVGFLHEAPRGSYVQVASPNAAAWTHALRTLLQAPEGLCNVSRAGRAYALNHLSAEQAMEKWLAVYQKLGQELRPTCTQHISQSHPGAGQI